MENNKSATKNVRGRGIFNSERKIVADSKISEYVLTGPHSFIAFLIVLHGLKCGNKPAMLKRVVK